MGFLGYCVGGDRARRAVAWSTIGCGYVSPSMTPAACELQRSELGRCVDARTVECGELGHEAAHVVAVGIEATGLRERIEHAEIRARRRARCRRPIASCRRSAGCRRR